ncbi:MAG: multicopper oxidase domain-containing protein [Saprospiraceae bacterium]
MLLMLCLSFAGKAHVAVDYPAGGETFTAGETVTIQWHIVIPHNTLNWDLFFSSDGGTTWEAIQMDVPPGELSYQWTVPPIATTQGRVLVIMDNSATDYQDASSIFTIESAPPSGIAKTLYINKGQMTTVDGQQFPALAFNDSPAFDATNYIIHLEPGDLLNLTVVNNDSQPHNFQIKNLAVPATPIAPGDSVTYDLAFPEKGFFNYYDDLTPSNYYMGLAGMVVVDDFAGKHFFWNLREHESAKNIAIGNGQAVDFTEFEPDYFTINGHSHPDLANDPLAIVQGNVGDTIRVYICNSGLMSHSIHFHGYHLKIIDSSKYHGHQGRVKDTFPIDSRETLILEFVPDKPGMYPVHDHNLVAVTGGAEYPNGMLLIMNIQ